MILATTIQNRLLKVVESPETFCYDFDIRYLQRWVNLHPQCFPKFILKGKFEPKFIWNDKLEDFSWEIHKIN